MPKFNNVELSEETILATRQWFADNCQACIDEVLSGAVVLPSHTKPEDYFVWCNERAAKDLAGEGYHTWTFLQRAYWIQTFRLSGQTGEMLALLP